jgi:hypothetical protein
MAPDEAALTSELEGLEFKLGVLRKKWTLEEIRFPVVYFGIAAPRRDRGPRSFLLRSECTGYCAAAPTSQLWDGQTDTALPLAQRPFGKTGVLIAFSDWKPCLYHPIDRQAREHWPNQFPELTWQSNSNINTLLETVHALINHPDYLVSTAPDGAAHLSARAMEVSAT